MGLGDSPRLLGDGMHRSLPKALERLRRGPFARHLDHRYRAASERIGHPWVLRRLCKHLRRGLVHMLPQIKVSTLQTGNRMIPRRAAAKVTRNAPATNSASNFSQLAQRPSYMSNANLRRTGERSEKGKVSILHKVTISIITLSLDSVIYWIRSKEVGSLLSHSSWGSRGRSNNLNT